MPCWNRLHLHYSAAGCIYEAPTHAGLAALSCEMAERAAGRVTVANSWKTGKPWLRRRGRGLDLAHAIWLERCVGQLNEVLAIFADVVQKPHLLESQFDDAKLVCLQRCESSGGRTFAKLMQELRRRHYAEPWGRSQQGTSLL